MRAAKPVTVLRILTRLNVGGPSRHAFILHRELEARGYRSILAAGRSEGREGDIADWFPTHVHRIPGLRRGASPIEAAQALASLHRLIGRVRPQIVHTHMAMAGFVGRLSARLQRTPVLLHTYHGHVLEGYFSERRAKLYTFMERRLSASTTALVAVSQAVRNSLLEMGIGRPEDWCVIPVGLDLDRLLELHPPPAARTVGIVGRLVPIKDHETYLQAIDRLPREVHGVIVGDGDLRRPLEARVVELGLSGRVSFRGWIENLVTLYSDLDVVVLTSRNEGTPVALIEAMAAGRPVVATDVGGVRDVIDDGVTGLLVPPGDPVALSHALTRLEREPALRRSLVHAAREAATNRFGATRLADDVDALYGRLLRRSTGA